MYREPREKRETWGFQSFNSKYQSVAQTRVLGHKWQLVVVLLTFWRYSQQDFGPRIGKQRDGKGNLIGFWPEEMRESKFLFCSLVSDALWVSSGIQHRELHMTSWRRGQEILES